VLKVFKILADTAVAIFRVNVCVSENNPYTGLTVESE
jgi:hypothetical protein